MSKSTPPGSERDGTSLACNPQSSNSVAAALETEEESRVQGVDITDDVKGSLDDDASEEEEDDELDEAETVEKEARANQC
jgi:hypothetical protein